MNKDLDSQIEVKQLLILLLNITGILKDDINIK